MKARLSLLWSPLNLALLLTLGMLGFAILTQVVEPNYVGLRISSGGQILAVDLPSGRYGVVPGYSRLVSLPRAAQPYFSDKSHVATTDGVQLDVNFSIPWVIADPLAYWKAFGTTDVTPGTRQVDNIAYSDVKEKLRGLSFAQITAGQDSETFQTTVTRTNEKLTAFGIKVLAIRMVEVDLQPSAKQVAMQAQVRAVEAQANEIKAKTNERVAEINARTARKVGEIRGEANAYDGKRRGQANAEALKILQAAVPDAGLYQQLEATKAIVNLPEGTKIFLGPDSPLYQVLQGR